MKTFEELKKSWNEGEAASIPKAYDEPSLERIFKSRANNQVNKAMQYFWPAFAWQIVVYALLSHVIAKYWSDNEMLGLSIAGVFLFLPFTIMLMKKFKSMAIAKPGDAVTSLHQHMLQQHGLLLGFYRFKKGYELMLIPLSAAIGTLLIFKLYVPGGVYENPLGAGITLSITLVLFVIAIRQENKMNFEQPLHRLSEILEDFNQNEVHE